MGDLLYCHLCGFGVCDLARAYGLYLVVCDVMTWLSLDRAHAGTTGGYADQLDQACGPG